MNATSIITILDWALTLLDVGSTAYLKMQESRARVQAIRDEGRDPTSEEWDALFSTAQGHHDTIQNS